MKQITFEQFRKINNYNSSGFIATRRFQYDFDEERFYLNDDRVQSEIDSDLFYIKYYQSEIVSEVDFVEQLNSTLVYELETDKECKIRSDGTLFLSWDYEEFKKTIQKRKNNCSSKISKLKLKIKDRGNRITRLIELRNYIKTIEVVKV